MCRLYRVDKRIFSVGELIKPQTVFEQQLDGKRKLVEDLLNQTRPHRMPERKECLFLFFELAGALKFFQKYGGNVYRVHSVDCLYRGDMNKIDNLLDLAHLTNNMDLLTEVARDYWQDGTHTFMPCYEILTSGCVVEECLDVTKNQNSFLLDMQKFGSIEKTQLYVSFLANSLERLNH